MRALVVLVLSLGCGSAPPSRPATEAAEAPVPTAEAAEVPPPLAPGPDPEVALAPAAHLEVPPPADLASAIAARLPTIELVPPSCRPPELGTVSYTDERVCLYDREHGVFRAMRRFATSREPAVWAGRTGDDVIFSVMDPGDTATRYDGRVWRWELGPDRYVGLIGSGDLGYYAWVGEADFGAVIDAEDHRWVFAAGELSQVRRSDMDDGLLAHMASVDGRTYVRTDESRRQTLSIVHREGPRLVVDRVASYPWVSDRALCVAFPGGRPLVISAYPRGASSRLYVVEPPASEVREVEVAVRQPREARWVDGTLQLRTRDGVVSVDLSTGATSPAPAWPEPTSPLEFGSIWWMGTSGGEVVLARSGSRWTLSASGVARGDDDEDDRPARTPCRCEEASLRCGDELVASACTDVAELERISDPYREDRDPSSVYSRELRVDRLEPDYVRITRLSDGARLWVRILGDGVFAQADDGAFVLPEGESDAGWALRWGRSLLESLVTPLSASRAAFERPTLLTDFFAGRALPTADTTLVD